MALMYVAKDAASPLLILWSGEPNVPFISAVSLVQIGNRAPAHGTANVIFVISGGSDGTEIIVIEGAVARSSKQRTLSATATMSEREYTICVSRHCMLFRLQISEISDSSFQVNNT